MSETSPAAQNEQLALDFDAAEKATNQDLTPTPDLRHEEAVNRFLETHDGRGKHSEADQKYADEFVRTQYELEKGGDFNVLESDRLAERILAVEEAMKAQDRGALKRETLNLQVVMQQIAAEHSNKMLDHDQMESLDAALTLIFDIEASKSERDFLKISAAEADGGKNGFIQFVLDEAANIPQSEISAYFERQQVAEAAEKLGFEEGDQELVMEMIASIKDAVSEKDADALKNDIAILQKQLNSLQAKQGEMTDDQKEALTKALDVSNNINWMLETLNQNLEDFVLEGLDEVEASAEFDSNSVSVFVVMGSRDARIGAPVDPAELISAPDTPEVEPSLDTVDALGERAKEAFENGDVEAYDAILVELHAAFDALAQSGDIEAANIQDELDNWTLMYVAELADFTDDFKFQRPLAIDPETNLPLEIVPTVENLRDSSDFNETLNSLNMNVNAQRSKLARLSAQSRMKLFGRKEARADLAAAQEEYDAALAAVREHLKTGYSEKEDVDFMVAYGLASEKKQTTEEEWSEFSKSKYGNFLNWYASKSKNQKRGIGIAVGLTAGAAGFLTGGAAVAGAGALAARFTRGYMNNAGKESFEEKAAADQAKLEADLSMENGFDSEQNIGLVSAHVERRIAKDQKDAKRAAVIGVATVAAGVGIGRAIGYAAEARTGFNLNVIDNSLGIPDNPLEILDGIGGDASEVIESVPETPDVITERIFEDFVDTDIAGDGVTHTLRDLAAAEGFESFEPLELYDLHNQFKTELGQLPNTSILSNGDVVLNDPAEGFTVPADLRERMVAEMAERKGVPVPGTESVSSIADFFGADAAEGATNIASEVSEQTIDAATTTSEDLLSAAYTETLAQGSDVTDILQDYMLNERNISLTDSEVDDLFAEIVAANPQLGSAGAIAESFPGTSNGVVGENGEAGISQLFINQLDRELESSR